MFTQKYIVSPLMATVLLALLCEPVVAAEKIVSSVKLRAGQVVASETGAGNGDDTFFDSYFVKLNKKTIFESGVDVCNCYFQGVKVGPYAVGENDIIGIGTSWSGSGASSVTTTFFIINKNGQVTKPKVFDISGKLQKDADGSISCMTGDDFGETKLIGNKITTSCTERDGRRSMIFKYSLEGDSIRVSR